MDERVRVDELDRGREGHDALGLTADGASGGERQHRSDALAAGEERVPHRVIQAGRGAAGRGEAKRLQVPLDGVA